MTVLKSQQQWNRFWWPPLWFWTTRAVFICACMYEFRKVRIKGARRFYFVVALLFRANVQTHLGDASIREGVSNRDITVIEMRGHIGERKLFWKISKFIWNKFYATILSSCFPTSTKCW